MKKGKIFSCKSRCKWTLQDHLVKLSAKFCSFFLKIISRLEPSTINLISLGSDNLLYFESSNFNGDPPPVEVVYDGLDNDERHHPGSRLPHQVGHLLHISVYQISLLCPSSFFCHMGSCTYYVIADGGGSLQMIIVLQP